MQIVSIIRCILSHRTTSFPTRYIHVSSVVRRYKKKWVEMGRKKVLPRELALSYFDTYYPNIYGEDAWKDARLALLHKKKKHCALVNNFADTKQTTIDLMCDQQAYDMFNLVGKKFEQLCVEDGVPEVGSTQPNDLSGSEDKVSEEMTFDLSDSTPGTVTYEETPEGFMVPRQTEVDPSSKPNHPPDLYDYVPASQQLTAKDQLEQDLGRQSLMLGIESNIEIIPHEALMIPPMLKCYIHEPGNIKSFFSAKQDESTRMLQYYLLDGASILPVLALNIKPGDKILDLCAAPGGKSLAMAQCLIADEIVCVDTSWSRLNRLKDTLRWHVPGVFDTANLSGTRMQVILENGEAVGHQQPDRYDKVLVDVPCNTDREVLTSDENNRFKRTRVTERLRLPQVQADLLKSGIRACRAGGTIVYSTCTLTPGQNDYVVEAALTQLQDSHPNIKVVVQECSDIADRLAHIFKFWTGSKYGQVVLPTPSANFGPGYFAKLVRVE